MKIRATLDKSVQRGSESWTYIYVMLGFALAIEATVITMITPLEFPWNLIAFVVAAALTFWLFLCNGWFQNKLIGLKIAYENKWRRRPN